VTALRATASSTAARKRRWRRTVGSGRGKHVSVQGRVLDQQEYLRKRGTNGSDPPQLPTMLQVRRRFAGGHRPRRAPSPSVCPLRAVPLRASAPQTHAQFRWSRAAPSTASRNSNGARRTPPRQCARDRASLSSTGHPSYGGPVCYRVRTQCPVPSAVPSLVPSPALARCWPRRWLLSAPRLTSRYERHAPRRQVHRPRCRAGA